MGVRRFDFYGARIAPQKGSKQDALARFKRSYGAELKTGYMWKCEFNRLSGLLYRLAVKVRSGGDIVDQEFEKIDRESAGRT
jgi:hypothetical protein